MLISKDLYLRAFSNVNIHHRKQLNCCTQYDFANNNTRWHHKQWSLYEKPINMKLLTMHEVAHCLKLSAPQYLRHVADEMEQLIIQASEGITQ